MGEFLGYEMRMTLNTAYPIKGKYDKNWHFAVISFNQATSQTQTLSI